MTRTLQTFSSCCSILLLLFLTACLKDKGKLTPVIPPLTGCDTVTYAKYIKPIADQNCAISGCHDGSTGLPDYRTYEGFKDRAQAGRVKIRAIDVNPTPMPPDAAKALTDQQKQLITCWLTNGYREN